MTLEEHVASAPQVDESATRIVVPKELLAESFATMRRCGNGRRECQVLWIGPWTTPDVVTRVVHPRHRSFSGGYQVDDGWLNEFWVELARGKLGIRAQVHTHPHDAFHSSSDDTYPIIRTSGFLSLVIPDFAQGRIGLDAAYLAEVQPDGTWQSVDPASRIIIK